MFLCYTLTIPINGFESDTDGVCKLQCHFGQVVSCHLQSTQVLSLMNEF